MSSADITEENAEWLASQLNGKNSMTDIDKIIAANKPDSYQGKCAVNGHYCLGKIPDGMVEVEGMYSTESVRSMIDEVVADKDLRIAELEQRIKELESGQGEPVAIPGSRFSSTDEDIDVAFKWISIFSREELTAFYLSRLPKIREAARLCGYAIGTHGSLRRDFDLIAVPWIENPKSKDELAKAVHRAACGLHNAEFKWEQKTLRRMATSMPICWIKFDHPKDELSLGHIDLSVISEPSSPTTQAAVAYALLKAEGICAHNAYRDRKDDELSQYSIGYRDAGYNFSETIRSLPHDESALVEFGLLLLKKKLELEHLYEDEEIVKRVTRNISAPD